MSHLDLAAAERVRTFFRKFLRHTDGEFAGKPFELLPWQWELIKVLFGTKNEKGFRQYRKLWLEIAKKNGKSALLAAVGIYMLVADGEPGARIVICSTSIKNARNIYLQAEAMVKACPQLYGYGSGKKRQGGILDITPNQKRITYAAKNGSLEVLSTEAESAEGIQASAVFVDEIHVWNRKNSEDLYSALRYATAARRQGLFCVATTAGDNTYGLGYQEHQYAAKVLTGEVEDPSYLPIIYAADSKDDWTTLATLQKANPSLGSILQLDEVQPELTRAKIDPRAERDYKRYRLNLWQQPVFTDWLPAGAWDACKSDLKDLSGRECYAGLDLSSTTDTTSLVLVFPLADGSVDVQPFCWIPEDACKDRERKNRSNFDTWTRQGLMYRTPGEVIDYDLIRAKINELSRQYRITELAVDPWNATQLSLQLSRDGLNVIHYPCNSRNLNEPCKMISHLVLSRKLRHDGNPVMSWQMSNVVMRSDSSGNIKPCKASSADKIDSVVAMACAVGRLILRQSSAYETQGLTTF